MFLVAPRHCSHPTQWIGRRRSSPQNHRGRRHQRCHPHLARSSLELKDDHLPGPRVTQATFMVDAFHRMRFGYKDALNTLNRDQIFGACSSFHPIHDLGGDPSNERHSLQLSSTRTYSGRRWTHWKEPAGLTLAQNLPIQRAFLLLTQHTQTAYRRLIKERITVLWQLLDFSKFSVIMTSSSGSKMSLGMKGLYFTALAAAAMRINKG